MNLHLKNGDRIFVPTRPERTPRQTLLRLPVLHYGAHGKLPPYDRYYSRISSISAVRLSRDYIDVARPTSPDRGPLFLGFLVSIVIAFMLRTPIDPKP